MERELIITGIGGQGVQLASAVVAQAAMAEGRDVQVFGSYGGMMRGGATEATIVVADEPVESPPTVGTTWSGILMHHEHAAHTLACLRPGSLVLVNSSVVVSDANGADRWPGAGWTVVELPASDIAVELGHVMAASMVMIGAYVTMTGLVQPSSLIEAARGSLPDYRSRHLELNQRALNAGFGAVEPGSVPAWALPTVGLR